MERKSGLMAWLAPARARIGSRMRTILNECWVFFWFWVENERRDGCGWCWRFFRGGQKFGARSSIIYGPGMNEGTGTLRQATGSFPRTFSEKRLRCGNWCVVIRPLSIGERRSFQCQEPPHPFQPELKAETWSLQRAPGTGAFDVVRTPRFFHFLFHRTSDTCFGRLV